MAAGRAADHYRGPRAPLLLSLSLLNPLLLSTVRRSPLTCTARCPSPPLALPASSPVAIIVPDPHLTLLFWTRMSSARPLSPPYFGIEATRALQFPFSCPRGSFLNGVLRHCPIHPQLPSVHPLAAGAPLGAEDLKPHCH
jgi:hypothetical protein